LEADERLETLKHYFGITYDGELVMRGMEARRLLLHPIKKEDENGEIVVSVQDAGKIYLRKYDLQS
jgi:hypothetical protein